MKEDLLQRAAVEVRVGLEDSLEEPLRGLPTQVELAFLLRVPRGVLSEEHDTVARVEEHLRRTARRCTLLVALSEREADVADALARLGESPRLRARLIVERRREVPRAVG